MPEPMTAKERVLAAANHRLADRVPMTFDAEKEIYAALHKHFGTDSKERLFDRLGVDTWYVRPQDKAAQQEDGDRNSGDEESSIL